MTIYHILLIICWAAFLIYWGVSALSAKKTKSAPWKWLLSRVVILALLVVVARQGIFQGAFRNIQLQTFSNPVLGGIGVLLCAFGIGFAIWARRHLGRNWGMPRAIKENPELVTSGPYAYVRHPIYTGMILALLGSGLVAGWSWLLLCPIFSVYFIYSAMAEERLMLKQFPETYPAYKSRTKMLVPFVF